MVKICPVCRKSFADKVALRAHMSSAHPTQATRAQPKPLGQSKKARKSRKVRSQRSQAVNAGARVVAGLDLLGMYTFKASSTAGNPIMLTQLSPGKFAGTRWAAEAALWSRWRPRSLRLEITSSAGATVSGSYLLGWSADPDFTVGKGLAAVRRVTALNCVKSAQIYSTAEIQIPCDTLQKWYLVNSHESGETDHGTVVALQVGPVGNLATDSVITFTVILHYTVEFEGPKLTSILDIPVVYAEDDYTPYFTTSTSDWADGTKLSLKAHSGGGLVPFPTITPNTVYGIDSAAQLNYIIDNSTTPAKTGLIKYCVMIHNSPIKAVAVFASKTQADKYASTADNSYCLEYKAAGAYCTPTNPPWRAESMSRELVLADKVDALQRQVEELMGQLRVGRSSQLSDLDFPLDAGGHSDC